MGKIRVLVAGKQALLREGICALLKACASIEVAGEATSGQELLDMISREDPDVILIDTPLPVPDNTSVPLRTGKEGKTPRLLFLIEAEDKESIMRGIAAKGSGFILKEATPEDLVTAITTVHSSGYFLYPPVAKKVVEEYLNIRNGRTPNSYDLLSDREKEVFKLIAEGYHRHQIAELLDVSLKTVLGHRANLMRKLGIHNQIELVKYAIRKHLIEIKS